MMSYASLYSCIYIKKKAILFILFYIVTTKFMCTYI